MPRKKLEPVLNDYYHDEDVPLDVKPKQTRLRKVKAPDNFLAEIGKKYKRVELQPKKVRQQNNWTEHVKQYCAENGVAYRDALRSADCKNQYKKV